MHASQTAAARSLGLSRWQTLRFVIVPQAVRRVIPPLLNDFIALQKDTALIAVVAGTPPRRSSNRRSTKPRRSTSPRSLGAAICFLAITLPLTRFTDWFVARQRKRRQAGAAV